MPRQHTTCPLASHNDLPTTRKLCLPCLWRLLKLLAMKSKALLYRCQYKSEGILTQDKLYLKVFSSVARVQVSLIKKSVSHSIFHVSLSNLTISSQSWWPLNQAACCQHCGHFKTLVYLMVRSVVFGVGWPKTTFPSGI